jgi:hypothetical protein
VRRVRPSLTAFGDAPFVAVGVRIAMLVTAVVLLMRAHRAFTRLAERRAR